MTVGSPLTYTLRITDTGGFTTGVVVTDTLPAYTQFGWAGKYGALTGGDVVWSGFGLAAGAGITLTFGVTTTCAPDGAQIVNGSYRASASEWLTPTLGTAAAVTAAFPLPLSIETVSGGARLTWWHPCSGLAHYAVYRAEAPYLAPGAAGSTQIATVTAARARQPGRLSRHRRPRSAISQLLLHGASHRGRGPSLRHFDGGGGVQLRTGAGATVTEVRSQKPENLLTHTRTCRTDRVVT